MKIRKMVATFGKLDKAELCLEDGLNILNLPNEGGKSTWSAFILAMFYGIDTSERAAKGTLPAKTKFKPWSGAAMEGRMELSWDGREITIERRSKGRVPMGEFSAYETESGLPVTGLTAENCGIKLLGVEKAVFERSAFLRQLGWKVDQTGALEQRLGALVTTGEETVSYSDTEKRLRDWKNAVRHNKTGELPKLERELDEVEETLHLIRANQSGAMELRAREEEKNAEWTRLQRIERGLKAAEYKRQKAMVDRAADDSREKKEKAEVLRRSALMLPEEQVLRRWQQEWAELQTERRSMPVSVLSDPVFPEVHAGFAGRNSEEIDSKVRKDLFDYDAYEAAAKPLRIPFPWLAVVLAAAAVGLAILFDWWLGLACLLFAAGVFGLYIRKKNADERERNNASLAAREILKAYGVASRDEIPALAAKTKTNLTDWQLRKEEVSRERQHRQKLEETLRDKENGYLEKLRHALPNFAGEPVSALHRALLCHQEMAQAEREAAEATRYYAQLAETLRPAEDMAEDVENVVGYDATEVRMRMMTVQRELQDIRSALDRAQGQISTMGDPAELASRKETLRSEIAEKEQQWSALNLAMEVLGRANSVLQTQFAPEISRTAAQIMGKLTDGRYDKVMLDQQLSVSARETGEIVSRELIALSQGTGDQLYLSLRLAICDAVLPGDTPLVLDDALVNFDDVRAAAALGFLREKSERRQILLFTCHNREKNIVKTS